jgi:hypothetical protein
MLIVAKAFKMTCLGRGARANVTGFGVPEHHGDGSALPVLVQSGNPSREIWSSAGCRVKAAISEQLAAPCHQRT